MTSVQNDSKKTVSLVLGSGGARGLAHIGVIRWLIENGYEIRSISGCSMGALVGGVYAAGKLDEFEQWVRAINRRDMLTLLDLSWQAGGLVKGDRIIDTLVDLVGDQNIEDLGMQYTAVAADINEEKEVWINRGSLFEAIRASISLPLFFTPVVKNQMTLIDGGVLNPVPIAPTFGDDTDLTIAVNLGATPPPSVPKSEVEIDESEAEEAGFHQKIDHFLSSLKETFSFDDEPQDQPKPSEERGMYEVANLAFDAMQSTIARQKLAVYPPDVVINISRTACGMLEFNRASEMIDLGYERAKAKLGN
ncbi:MAG: patatin-like phospholipase family protein [Pontibacterium sp.]